MGASVRETREHKELNEGSQSQPQPQTKKEMECSNELPPVEWVGRKGWCVRGS